MSRRCTKCREEFPANPEHFHRSKNNKYGLSPICKPCANAKALKNHYDNRAERLKKMAVYRDENREALREKAQETHKANPEPKRKRDQRYAENNKAKISEKSRQRYRHADKRPYQVQRVKWAENNPEKAKMHERNKRMKRRGAPLDAEARKYVGIIQNDPCAYCGEKPNNFEIDHVVPIRAGGKSNWDNLAPSCRKCNAEKGGKSLLEFLIARGVA